MQLRQYQSLIKQDVYDAWQSHQNVLAVAPTGSGKTTIFSSILHEHNGMSCAIAHRQELVGQISLALAREEVRHKIIAPNNVIRNIINEHQRELDTSYFDPNASCAVAGVNTLLRRADQLKPWLHQITKWVMDECFPAGTLVDGTPIEDIKVGDYVMAFNEYTGDFGKRKVIRLFKNPKPKDMVSIHIGHHVLRCTRNHPIWTNEGWVNAEKITTKHQVYYMQETGRYNRVQKKTLFRHWQSILQQTMCKYISGKSFVKNDESDKQKVCIETNDKQQPNATTGSTGESIEYFENNKAQAENSRWKRETTNRSGSSFVKYIRSFRIRVTSYCQNGVQSWRFRLPESLQNRLRQSCFKTWNRSRWEQPLCDQKKAAGQKERCIFKWVRVDDIKIYESGDSERNSQSDKHRYVYNIEVDDFHTYVANGVVVHNCHHVLEHNQWGKAVQLMPNAIGLGVTATPIRADGKGLGRHSDGLMDCMVEGPSMRDLIDMGFLTDYRVFAPPSDLDISHVDVSKKTGDFKPDGLKKAVKKSHLVGDVVEHYLRIAPGKLGVTFATDVETATEMAQQYNYRGVPTEIVSAKTPDRERNEIIRQFRAGTIKQLVNVDIFGEGFDLPAIEVCSMARPTQSYSLFVQQFGRACRIMPGKTHAIIIDHAGNVVRHGLPDKEKIWSLDARDKTPRSKNPDDDIPLRYCVNCTQPYERIQNKCPYCGHTPIPEGRSKPEHVDGDLFELTPDVLAQMRGQVQYIDQPPELVRDALFKKGSSQVIINSAMKNHKTRQEIQAALRGSIAWWSAYQREAGRTDSQIYRLFYHLFGVDIMTAQTYGKPEALILAGRINNYIGSL